MDARTFFDKFTSLFQKGSDTYRTAASCYHDKAAFTNAVLQPLGTLLGAQSNNRINKEYFKIDLVVRKNKDTGLTAPKPFVRHLWDLELVLEHENDENQWMDEVVKLAHICCPLRVVIGYLPINHHAPHANHQVCLDYIAAELDTLGCRHNLTQGEFLIIIGNSHTGHDTEKYFGYLPYLYCAATKKFEKMEDWLAPVPSAPTA